MTKGSKFVMKKNRRNQVWRARRIAKKLYKLGKIVDKEIKGLSNTFVGEKEFNSMIIQGPNGGPKREVRELK